MPRNITVTFGDGTTHVYQNAPDDATPEQVSARAAKDFGKTVTSLDGAVTGVAGAGRLDANICQQAGPRLLGQNGGSVSQPGEQMGEQISDTQTRT